MQIQIQILNLFCNFCFETNLSFRKELTLKIHCQENLEIIFKMAILLGIFFNFFWIESHRFEDHKQLQCLQTFEQIR